MLPVLLNGLLRIGGLRYQQHVLLIVDDRGQAFAQKRMIIYTQNTNLGLCRHRVCSLADCDFSLLCFPRYSLDNHPARRPAGRYSKAIWPGTNNSTSVPATARLNTLNFPPILSALSFMPDRPQCTSRPQFKTCVSIPLPSSRIIT